MVKKRIFNKPVKYIFIGDPRLTKTTIANKISNSVFETDSFKSREAIDRYDLNNFDLSKEVIIIGGKFYKTSLEKRVITFLLKDKLCIDFEVILLEFKRGEYYG